MIRKIFIYEITAAIVGLGLLSVKFDGATATKITWVDEDTTHFTEEQVKFGLDQFANTLKRVCFKERQASTGKGDSKGCLLGVQLRDEAVATTRKSAYDYISWFNWAWGKKGGWNKPNMEDIYQNTCEKYRTNQDDQDYADKDESEALQDLGKEYPWKGFCHCLMSIMRDRQGNEAVDEGGGDGWTREDVVYGSHMVNQVMRAACWFERCQSEDGKMKELAADCSAGDQWREQLLGMDRFKDKPEDFLSQFGSTMSGLFKEYKLPGIYGQTCDLMSPEDKPDYNDPNIIEREAAYPYKAFCHCIMAVIDDRDGDVERNVHVEVKEKNTDSISPEDVEFGMRRVAKAFLLACGFERRQIPKRFERFFNPCMQAEQFLKHVLRDHKESADMLHHFFVYNTPTFEQIGLPLEHYGGRCAYLLDQYDGSVKMDESEVFGDEADKNYPWKGLAHCLVTVLRERGGAETLLSASKEYDDETVVFGMDIVAKAFEYACFYERFKVMPSPLKHGIVNKCSLPRDYFGSLERQYKDAPYQKMTYYSKFVQDIFEKLKLPKIYDETCQLYLQDFMKTWNKSEAEVYKDKGKDYPYRGFGHCMLSVLKSTRGKDAIPILKEELINRNKSWVELIVARENAHRSMHDVPPMELDEQLTQEAQAWADEMKAKCYKGHAPDAKHNGEPAGESLYIGCKGSNTQMHYTAYDAAGRWYAEIKDYPYKSGGFKGGDPELFRKIGHFTQTVWKDTKKAGYGMGFNPKCKNVYIVARYFPIGNVKGEFQANVLPFKESK